MSKSEYENEQSDIFVGKLTLPTGYMFPERKHADTFESVRTAVHRDKEIRVVTTYRITVDDVPITSHIMVADDGLVHTHGLPNYSFKSALDLAKQLIDAGEFKLPENELDSQHHGGKSA